LVLTLNGKISFKGNQFMGSVFKFKVDAKPTVYVDHKKILVKL